MDAKEKLKKIMVEWGSFELPKLHERDFEVSFLKGEEILSIIGARRAGKTYLCYQIIESLIKTVPKDNILYVNFEDERLQPLLGSELSLLWETYLEFFSVDLNKKVYLFLDEIQNVPNWSLWARRIIEQNKNLKLIITGSSSKLLSNEIATELRGRTISFTVYPLSFNEYLKSKNISPDKKNILYNSKENIIIKKEFHKYFSGGGFPAVLKSLYPDELLKEYYKVMFYRDLIERHKIKNIKLLEDYLILIMDQVGSLSSISSTAKKLEELGHSFSKNTLSNFSKYAEEIFLIFEVKKYTYKIREQMRNPKKIYAIDHGMLQAIRFSFSSNYGRILENIVFMALKRTKKEIFYHADKKECDFILTDKGKVLQVIQVCKLFSDSKIKEREIEGLMEALEAYDLKEGLILTEDTIDNIVVNNKKIVVLPVWFWLLSL
ncbi:hypothetical protein A3J90_01335 [candidate division WOR-1 bacterium RIFOXYC2_FULL_37_10]|uniref:AAA+ ATPase domain-containing protein n=1 Tax=candidate division WOR-1 bacterium RIFOXYB2_FULL_37_13 TaxID=1802579 RepID=A0A1F4SSZ4_UNCSA|nr:MAG: hypothetical protein A2246_01680 [candidate division WOR-1 bacterium RIFOXYA2_FULL_37_7]OGC23548.1 MAG: hypothetical protein A2310_03000 [candidate division WOR-1 bacterium RIFOXYB2_FULL_37_13]OGC35761.1 MAG: hypothetical protein A3J90_01335 [candidate division WOR-1 bacterium RIFOXYC2_FULL_37_10]